jgi:hypothetical protein
VLAASSLEQVEDELAAQGESARTAVDAAFRRFERAQPELSQRLETLLSRRMDETALALGHFLSIAIWLAFERQFHGRLGPVTSDALRATEEAIVLEEEIRAKRAEEPLDLDDIVAFEQPGVLSFVHGHVEAALEGPGDSDHDVDVDDVHKVYRVIVLMTLALSHAVRPSSGSKAGGGEMLA